MSTEWLLASVTYGLIAVAPIAALLALRRRLGDLNAASWLVIWGAFIAAGEHGGWAIADALQVPGFSDQGGLATNAHTRVHAFMAGIYTILSAVLLVVIARTLLQARRRVGWWALFVALVVGGGLEILFNGPSGILFQHGFPPRSRPEGVYIYAYIVAWLAALVITYRPVFGRAPRPQHVSTADVR